MPTTAPSRAASAAGVHLRPINESRRRAGLEPLTEAQVAHEFADVDRYPAKGSTLPTGTNQASADALWGGIVAKLNSSLPSSRAPIGAVRTSPAASNSSNRAVDWSAIATALNREAGLNPPSRSRAR